MGLEHKWLPKYYAEDCKRHGYKVAGEMYMYHVVLVQVPEGPPERSKRGKTSEPGDGDEPLHSEEARMHAPNRARGTVGIVAKTSYYSHAVPSPLQFRPVIESHRCWSAVGPLGCDE
jgi:hypothetical protein